MNHGTASGLLNPIWTTKRSKPKDEKAVSGKMGTISECLAGDVVACESLDGKRVIWLEIAWQWRGSVAAMVRVYDFRERQISLAASHMRTVQGRQRVRWLGVRPR